jgi:hypothetical protein
MRKILFLIIVGVGAILAATSVPANALTFNLDVEYSGATEPAGDPPWLTAEITDVALNTVEISMSTSGLTDSEFVGGWYFNWDFDSDDLSSVEFLVPPSTTDPGALSITFNPNGLDADGTLGFGFDILFNFPESSDDRFKANQLAVYEFIGEGLTASAFNFLNAAENFFSAAHVQGIANPDPFKTSGWIGATSSSAAIPEPGTILLLGAGLAGLFGARRFKFKKN